MDEKESRIYEDEILETIIRICNMMIENGVTPERVKLLERGVETVEINRELREKLGKLNVLEWAERKRMEMERERNADNDEI